MDIMTGVEFGAVHSNLYGASDFTCNIPMFFLFLHCFSFEFEL